MRLVESVNGKKLLFITHKEYSAWSGRLFWSLRHKLVVLPLYLWFKLRARLLGWLIFIQARKMDAAIILHWGFYVKKPSVGKEIAFHLIDTDNHANLGHPPNSLHLTSKDFTPQASSTQKKFDFLSVSHNGRRKKLYELLLAFRKIKTACPSFRAVLLVNTPSKRFEKSTWDTEIDFLKYYYDAFAYKERQDIVLLRLSREMGLEGVASSFVYWLMTQARNFVLFSVEEGSAKVVKEAANVGCTVWVRESLKGGTTKNIPADAIRSFASDDMFVRQVIEMLGVQSHKKNSYVNEAAVVALERALQGAHILSADDKLNRQDFEFANKWLPAHHPDDIKALGGGVTADINDSFKMLKMLRDWRRVG